MTKTAHVTNSFAAVQIPEWAVKQKLELLDEEAQGTANAIHEAEPNTPEANHCPHCGESGGEPVQVISREFQGELGHGGIVEWIDEACSLCCDPRPAHD